MKYALTDLTREQLEAAEAAIAELEGSSKKAAKKMTKKAPAKKGKQVEDEDEEEDEEVDFDEEDEDEVEEEDEEDEEESEDEETEDEDEEDEEEDEEEEAPRSKSKAKTGTKTATKSKTSGKMNLQDMMTAVQAENKRLTKKLKSAEKAQQKINAVLKKNGAKSVRTLEAAKYATVLKALKAL